MGIRKNHTTLTPDEKARFIAALLQLKANGVYDRYVRHHRELFNSGIHRSVLFLPWHREFLRRLELDLQAIDASVSLPYWDWTTDRNANSSLWDDDFMGGNGVPRGGAVQNGPFAFGSGRWPLTERDSPSDPVELTRDLQLSQLPTANTVRAVLASVPYRVFVRNAENQSHNTVHTSVGGAAGTASSPNDPIFFLLHCNVDRLWALWQRQHPDQAAFQGDANFNLNTPLEPWQNEVSPPTPGSVINHTTLGYSYDDELAQPQQIIDLTVGAAPRPANIGLASERDWYRFLAPTAGIYTLETSGPTDVFMSLFGPNNQTDLVTSDDDSGPETNARIETQLSAGTYFIELRHYQAGGTGPYGIAVGGNLSPNPPPGLPEILVNGPVVQGNIAAANESDVYTFMVSAAVSHTITTSGSTDTFISLYGPNSQTSFVTQDDDSGPGTNSQIVRVLLPGQYFVRVRHYSPTGTGAYGISVTR
ncbi:tyrosinase family protein [Methylomonas koyamae]|uniref:tyrosinase family protein n=1 Tax=Methylomonas koyamae TaxID=702114 RepID=UPI00112B57CE|nr:tyrosinase family protein [Methylomonas koyamae]TPQ27214.1 tyrosinase/peptidase [Methylomonas koyamae]